MKPTPIPVRKYQPGLLYHPPDAKLCPFCKGSVQLLHYHFWFISFGWAVECYECKARRGDGKIFGSASAALDHWNYGPETIHQPPRG